MGSVGIVCEDESQPVSNISKKCKSSSKLLDECSVFNGASVPRKLRSAVKKQRRESITLPQPVPRKQRHVSSGTETLRKPNLKKSKPYKRRKHITKDEEEVAETLFALADMFSDATKNDKPRLDVEISETKSSCIIEAGRSMTEAEDNVILTPQAEQLLSFTKQETPVNISALQTDTSSEARLKIFIPEMKSNVEQETAQRQIAKSGIQHEKHLKPDEKNYGLSQLSPVSSAGPLSSDKQGLFRLPPWFANATHNQELSKGPTVDKNPQVGFESMKRRKRSSTHLHICRMIKVLQLSSEKKERIHELSNQLTSNRALEASGHHLSINNQKRGINGIASFNGISYFTGEKNSSEVQNAILLHKRLLQDQHQASKASVSCSSLKQGSSNFLSLGSGGECGLNAAEGINVKGYSHEAMKQFHLPYLQGTSHFPSLSQNRYSSTSCDHTSAFPTQQVQLPPFLSSISGGHQSERRQAEWTCHPPFQYANAGANIRDWQNRGKDPSSSSSLVNCAQALFPHLHSALGPKYPQLTPSQQHQLMAMNSSSSSSLTLPDVKRQNHLLHPPIQEKWFFAAHTGNM